MITPGKYRHYKGKDYQVFGVARHSETGEMLVVYKHLYEIEGVPADQLSVRPLEMFTEEVEVEGKMTPRFQYINNL